jgi:cell division protein FtsQ
LRTKKNIRRNLAAGNHGSGRLLSAAKYFVFAALPAALLAALIFLASHAVQTLFSIRSIVITGNEHLTDDELKSMAGIGTDENLFRISSRSTSSKLAASPWIRSVAVRKEFPDRLLVQISEAEPFALLDMKGKLFIVDDKGTLLEELRNIAVPFLPVILSNPYQEKEAFLEAINLAKAIKNTGLLSRKDHIEIISHKPQEMSLNADGVVVKIGSGEYEEKLARLADIEQEIKQRNISVDYIDLRFANRVLVSPVNQVVK